MNHLDEENTLQLKGKVALVTGGSGGIGRAIVRKLARAGADIVVHYRNNKAHADDLVKALTKEGNAAYAIRADFSTEKGCSELFAEANELSGGVSLLVNNAAVRTVAPYMEIDSDSLNEMMAANLNAPFHLIQIFAGQLPEGRHGAVVNIGSIEGNLPAKSHIHYSISKSGLEMLSRAVALELGSQNIRINTVSPGLINREGLELDWPDGVKRWKETVPLSRLGEGNDVANAVLFLLSDQAAWITGQNLVVDGGMSVCPAW
ncbi:MAG: glucose 1-dehydrogenase [Pseudomonadales bacterium]|nr:glucose 1-dehydrogenase [Pseudomonadales bacterium]